MSKVVQRNYSISGKNLEEIVEQVRLVLSYDGDVSKIVITRGNILAEYVVPNNEPPYGEVPDTPVEELKDVLGRLQLDHVIDGTKLNSRSIGMLTAALIQARDNVRSPVAWLISSQEIYKEWLGADRDVTRLLNIPVYVLEKEHLPSHNLVLLCAKTSAVSPLKSDFGVLIDMEELDGDSPR